METYGDLMGDLVDCDVEEINSQAVWTEQALDFFISQLKSIKPHTFSSEREMIQLVTNKMSHRNFTFTYDQIENKYNSLKKMYTEQKEKNQTIEAELSSLFGDNKAAISKRSNSEELPLSGSSLSKKTKPNSTEVVGSKSNNTSLDDSDKAKTIYWTLDTTKIFVNLLEELRPQLGNAIRTKRSMWNEISKRMNLQGFEFTSSQVENKWKSMLRYYRDRLEATNGKLPRAGSFSSNAFPELYNLLATSSMRYVDNHKDSTISFANDQKLPFDDDDYEDENNSNDQFKFEEVCPIPEITVVNDELDPVNVENQISHKMNESNYLETSTKLDKIAKEIENFRKDSNKYQNNSLEIKNMQLKAYKDRTAQFTRIGDALIGLIDNLKNKNASI